MSESIMEKESLDFSFKKDGQSNTNQLLLGNMLEICIRFHPFSNGDNRPNHTLAALCQNFNFGIDDSYFNICIWSNCQFRTSTSMTSVKYLHMEYLNIS